MKKTHKITLGTLGTITVITTPVVATVVETQKVKEAFNGRAEDDRNKKMLNERFASHDKEEPTRQKLQEQIKGLTELVEKLYNIVMRLRWEVDERGKNDAKTNGTKN